MVRVNLWTLRLSGRIWFPEKENFTVTCCWRVSLWALARDFPYGVDTERECVWLSVFKVLYGSIFSNLLHILDSECVIRWVEAVSHPVNRYPPLTVVAMHYPLWKKFNSLSYPLAGCLVLRKQFRLRNLSTMANDLYSALFIEIDEFHACWLACAIKL